MNTLYFVMAKKNFNYYFIALLILGGVLMFLPLKGFALTNKLLSCPGEHVLRYPKNMEVRVHISRDCPDPGKYASLSQGDRDVSEKQALDDYFKYSVNAGIEGGYNPFDFPSNQCELGCFATQVPTPPTFKPLEDIDCSTKLFVSGADITARYTIDPVTVTCALEVGSSGAGGTKAANTGDKKSVITGVAKKAATTKSGGTANGQTPAAVALSNRLTNFCANKKRATGSNGLFGAITSLCRGAASKSVTTLQRAESVVTFCAMAAKAKAGPVVKNFCAGGSAKMLAPKTKPAVTPAQKQVATKPAGGDGFFAGPDGAVTAGELAAVVAAIDAEIAKLPEDAKDKSVTDSVHLCNNPGYFAAWKHKIGDPLLDKDLKQVLDVIGRYGDNDAVFGGVSDAASDAKTYLFVVKSELNKWRSCDVDSLQRVLALIENHTTGGANKQNINIGSALGKIAGDPNASEDQKKKAGDAQAAWARIMEALRNAKAIDEKGAEIRAIDTTISALKAQERALREKVMQQKSSVPTTQPIPATPSTQPTQQTPSAQPTTQVNCTTARYDVLSWCNGPFRFICGNGYDASVEDCRTLPGKTHCVNIGPYPQDGRPGYRGQCE